MTDRETIEVLREHAWQFETSAAEEPGRILAAAADARLVLIGEAAHGAHEFYRMRAELTRSLIARHGFTLVAVEADWPDAYRVNRWVRGASRDETAAQGYRPESERVSHYFRAVCPINSTRSFTSTRRRPSSRWSGGRSTRSTHPRPTRRGV